MRYIIFFILPLFKTFAVEQPPLVSLGVGIFDVVKRDHRSTSAYRIEYKHSSFFKIIRPTVGLTVTVRGSSYLSAGVAFEMIEKGSNVVISPNFAIGYYREGGGKNLGYPLEFRSGLECAYLLRSNYRVGLHFYHVSNACLSGTNPGEESLIFFFAIPI